MSSYDVRDPGWYQPGPPREEDGALVFTRHADVTEAGRAERGGTLDGSLETLAAGLGRDPGQLHWLFWFAWARRPGSAVYQEMRTLLTPALREAAEAAPWAARAAARELAADWDGQADVVGLARGVTSRIAAGLTGIPQADAGPLIAEVLRASAQPSETMFDREPDGVAGYLAAWMDRSGPDAPGLAGAVIAARGAGRLSERDAQAMLFGALAASWETTSTATTLMLLYLAEAGGFVPELAAPPRRAEVIEETLRLGCPFPRDWLICTAPGVIGGTKLEPGTRVERRWAAASRDGLFGRDPGLFRPGRPEVTRHRAFGAGPHTCLGAPLARAVMDGVLQGVAWLLPGAIPGEVDLATGMVDGPTCAILNLATASRSN
jgi:cytochrome P450